ncbi:MAG: hypothetical protein RDV48_28115 [Candidatus Eremiobacteraeota bacterium]|nr:hypothetical protein [Candidatus Eremiobacteraeota bacterium]
MGQLENLKHLPPLAPTISLEPASSPSLKDRRKADSCSDEFVNLGFASLGSFTIPEKPGYVVIAFIDEKENIFGFIQEFPQLGIFAELRCYYEDGTRLRVSNYITTLTPEQRENKKAPQGENGSSESSSTIAINREGASVTGLAALMKESLGDKPRKALSGELFKACYENDYAEEAKHINEVIEQLNAQLVKRVC